MVIGGHLHAKGAVRNLKNITGSEEQQERQEDIDQLKRLEARFGREPEPHPIPFGNPPHDHKKDRHEYSAEQQKGTTAPPAGPSVI